MNTCHNSSLKMGKQLWKKKIILSDYYFMMTEEFISVPCVLTFQVCSSWANWVVVLILNRTKTQKLPQIINTK